MGKDGGGHFFLSMANHVVVPVALAWGQRGGQLLISGVGVQRAGFCLYSEFDLSPAYPRHVRAGDEPLSVLRSAQSLSAPGSWGGALNAVSAPVLLSLEPSRDSV